LLLGGRLRRSIGFLESRLDCDVEWARTTDTLRAALLLSRLCHFHWDFLDVDVMFPDVLVPLHYYPVGRSRQVLAISVRCQMYEEGTSESGYVFE
jgi:hypothetical protein